MNNEQIENRIKGLTAERASLESAHNALVQQNQKLNQEFQQTVMQNQTRFAQLTGAITELQQLVRSEGDNHDNSFPTLSRSDRIADVRVGQQSESR